MTASPERSPCVTRIDDDKVRNRAHQSKVFDPLMRAPIASGQSGQARDDLYVGSTEGTAYRDEIIGAPSGKNAIRRAERNVPGSRQPGGDTNPILLRHANIEESLRELLREGLNVRVFSQIRRQANDLGFVGQLL
jgi:hypothetical protein